MAFDSAPVLKRYLAHRHLYECLGLVLVYAADATANAIVTRMDLARAGLGGRVAAWEPWAWEFSSVAVLLALLPLIAAANRRFPISWGQARRSLLAHLLLTVPYSLVHVCTMVGLRVLIYRLAGSRYDFGDWPRELLYEYLKDVRTYGLTLSLIYLYNFLLLRLQGEARWLAAPDSGPPVEPIERPQRFLVRKLGKEFLVAVGEVEWVEAAGNYVNLYVRGRHYPLRATMATIEERLDPEQFVRVHRSYIVRLSQIASIEPLDTGDARLQLRDGTVLPCSRRHRAALRTMAAV